MIDTGHPGGGKQGIRCDAPDGDEDTYVGVIPQSPGVRRDMFKVTPT